MASLSRHTILAGAAAAVLFAATPMDRADAAEMRIAFGDVAAIESTHFLAAFERAKERGVDVQITYLQAEDIAAQAVVSGQMDTVRRPRTYIGTHTRQRSGWIL
jgi:NitT/TauT family transport system substrate-binding protein